MRIIIVHVVILKYFNKFFQFRKREIKYIYNIYIPFTDFQIKDKDADFFVQQRLKTITYSHAKIRYKTLLLLCLQIKTVKFKKNTKASY